MRRVSLSFGLGLVLLATQSACSTYYPYYDYTPRPHETQLHQRPDPGGTPSDYDRLLARVLTTVIGVQRASDSTGGVPRVHLRILVENLTDQPMTLDTAQCQLTTADLRSLTPIAEPGPDPVIVPGATQEVNLYYPLDAGVGDVNLDGLNLKWSVTLDGNQITSSSAFGRIEYEQSYYEPWGYGWYAGGPFWSGGTCAPAPCSVPCPPAPSSTAAARRGR